MDIQIDEMDLDDWPAVRTIFAESLESPIATFESSVPGWSKWDASRIKKCRLVARCRTDVFGWATLSSAPST